MYMYGTALAVFLVFNVSISDTGLSCFFQVTGDANESQVVLSVKLYLDRPELLLKSLNNLFAIFKYHECTDQIKALHVSVVIQCIWAGLRY